MPAYSCRAWVEHRSHIGSHKTLAHAAWGVAGALDCLQRNNIPGARARLAILLMQFDQVAIDAGNWYLAAELGLELPPPFSALDQHRAPNTMAGESPYSRILDPRWAELSVTHLREQEDFVTKRKALGKPAAKANLDDDAEPFRRKPKLKPKAKASPSEPSA